MPFCAAWAGHTDVSREMAQDVHDAIVLDCALKLEAAASTMGLTLPQLSRQLAGREPLNHWRLASLGLRFEIALAGRRLKRTGHEVLTPEQIALLRGAARLGPRRMLKLGLDFIIPERRIG